MKILLLEDNVALNRAIVDLLERELYEVVSYYDGKTVLEDLKKGQNFDFFILDIEVPKVNGIEVLKYIKERDERAKVIMISVLKDIETQKKTFRYGCLDFIEKPFQRDKLLMKIKSLSNFEKSIINNPLDEDNSINSFKLKTNIEFTPKEIEFLSLIYKNIGKTVTYESIYNLLYEGVINEDALRQVVSRLKLKIDSNKCNIEAIYGVGYKLTLK